MGHFRLFRRVHIAPGLTVNLAKTGPSLSLGVRGAHCTLSRTGIRNTVGLPGSGCFYSSKQGWHSGAHTAPQFTSARPTPPVQHSGWQTAGRVLLVLLEGIGIAAVGAFGILLILVSAGTGKRRMKLLFCFMALLFLSASASSQPYNSHAGMIQYFCHAPEVTSGPEYQRMVSIQQRLTPILERAQGHEIHFAAVESSVINAWENNLTGNAALICIPTAMVRFMGDSEGEMAFIYAHEIGHALDDTCKSNAGRPQIAPPTISGALDKLLGGSGRNALAEQRTCEARADEIGFRIFTAAGYNPFDAAGAFGRMEMYLGDTSTGVFGRLAALGNDHPITPDRIRHMRVLLFQSMR